MKEIWRDIKGYEGLYQVSSFGKVRSLNYRRSGLSHTITQHKRNKKRKSYLSVSLYKEGILKSYQVHILVARAFPENCGEWFDGCEVDHIDTDVHNNCVTNLKVCTRRENMNNKLTKEHSTNSSKNRSVLQYDVNMKLVGEYKSTREAERKTGVPHNHISYCCNGKYGYRASGGFIWKYVEG